MLDADVAASGLAGGTELLGLDADGGEGFARAVGAGPEADVLPAGVGIESSVSRSKRWSVIAVSSWRAQAGSLSM
ncbi:hypothetical protein ACFP2T_05540 [Plantactinospora solaniradicis]|uniref:Uncharacterized protein n=1 Tax=Plantactinospora solaniradicis TaxID=1723736 RepID=A0ABW1K1L7_9ACTN